VRDTRTKEQKRFDRKQEIMGTIMGIYMRNNHMKPLPIDDKTLNEIADNIAPFFITLTQADYEDFKDTVKSISKMKLQMGNTKPLKKVLDKFALFC
jgi:hypothetical protein